MKYILVIVLLLIAATFYFILKPQPVYEVGKDKAAEATVESTVKTDKAAAPPVTSQQQSADEARITAMKAEYEKLEKARRNLERRLSRLKAVLYGKEIPSRESRNITEQMRNGYSLLKNKKLMASFNSTEEISSELSQVEYVSHYLETVENHYRAQRTQ